MQPDIIIRAILYGASLLNIKIEIDPKILFLLKRDSGVKLIEKRRGQELMSLLGLIGTLDKLARVSGVRWNRHVLGRNTGDVLRRALNFEVAGRRRPGRPNMTWKKQAQEYIDQIGMKKEDAIDRTKWRDGIYKLSRNMR